MTPIQWEGAAPTAGLHQSRQEIEGELDRLSREVSPRTAAWVAVLVERAYLVGRYEIEERIHAGDVIARQRAL